MVGSAHLAGVGTNFLEENIGTKMEKDVPECCLGRHFDNGFFPYESFHFDWYH